MAGDIPGLPDKAAVWFDDVFRPLHDFYLWCQTVDDRIRAGADTAGDLADEIAAIGDTLIIDSWCDFIAEVENDDITVQQRVPFAGTITGVVTDCDSGTCTVTTKIGGVSIGATNAVSTTQVVTSHNDVFAANAVISYTISANSACLGARIQINYTRQLVD